MIVHFFKLLVFPGLFYENQNQPSFDLDTARIIFYFGPTTNENATYSLGSLASVLEHPNFVHSQTTLYLSGHNETMPGSNTQMLAESFHAGNSTNFLAFDWQPLSNGPIVAAQFNLLRLIPRIADSVLALFAAGVDQESFNLIGLSLGTHGAGLVGQEIIARSQGNTRLSRVTYLDPPNPGIATLILPELTRDVARFVQAIHTDAGGKGISKAVAHADFWPNGGLAIQPECPPKEVNELCSHLKAGAYYAQSVANVHPEQLIGYAARDYADFLENREELMSVAGVPMGVNCPKRARGDFFLQIDTDYGQIPVVGLV